MKRDGTASRTSRRVAAAAALTMGALLVGTASYSQSNVTLTYVSYGGTGQDAQIKAWQEPYKAKAPNVSFTNTSPPDPAQVKAQVMTNAVQWNVVTTAPYLATQNCGTLYEKLSIPDLDKSQFPPGIIGDCYVGDFRYSLVFSYNADKWPDPANAPKTIADFFDTKKFPGKRGVVRAVQDGLLEQALLADGAKPESMYPLDVERALKKWATIKNDTIWAANPGALLQLITSKQVDMQFLVQARSQAALDAGANMIPVWDITVTSLDGLAVPKGSPHFAEIQKFLSFVMQPESQARMASIAGIGASNLLSKPTYTANGNKVNAFGPANTGKTFQIDPSWWSTNFNQTVERFTKWLNE
jgi:putative spermidine/putrescine transport system substrate-binding protein